MKNFFYKYFFPKLLFAPYYLQRVFLLLLNALGLGYFRREFGRKSTGLIIEAGEKGWAVLIELKELHQSAMEYWGEDKVHRLAVTKDSSYMSQMRDSINQHQPSHYMYDPRTGSQTLIGGILEAMAIGLLFFRKGVSPICVLTDLPVRVWRVKCSIVSALNGVVLTLMSPKDVKPVFPHNRLTGPMLMPFSQKNLDYLNELRSRTTQDPELENTCIFTGALYEPRTTILNNIKEALEGSGKSLMLKTRKLGEPRATEEQYWINIMQAPMVITTANQIKSKDTDWSFIPHLIYRYLEVPVAGALLLAQPVPGLEKYFHDGVHYVSYQNEQEAVEKIKYYLSNPQERDRIAKQGFEKAQLIVRSQMYWVLIDTNLKAYPIKN